MGHILVAGSVNVDRIWRLDAPLRGGARLTYEGHALRCGGGGFNTGAALLALGHAVTLVATLAEDDLGQACLDRLVALGFDIGAIGRSGRRTVPLDIFVDPAGERTILAPRTTEARRLHAVPPRAADIAYVNVRRMQPDVLAGLARETIVVAQVPLEAGERRPAQVLIGAAPDGGIPLGPDSFEQARRIAGPSLSTLVLTDGPRPVHLVEATGQTALPVAAVAGAGDTTGAGDVFAAGYIDALLRGRTAPEAVRHASAIAARFLADRRHFWNDAPLLTTD
ncbi:PfkB family carbohydrate kinase [Ancylobacter oerskovii]|uniref:PfkB family carbohydrate kinase n=1 Tax=Ancylobacter oerskovii TaxID=459519 RepID=A0ABW4YUG2_9HYPH|nr:PfkB family carbohydrate kinase [Ancylobacter oerskovii]MBS7543638.1 hypothetical protein [Ancylobacter oerskovii]